MNFQVDVSSTPITPVAEPRAAQTGNNAEVTDLLRQILDVQREQLNCARVAAAAHDQMARWRAFISRWQGDFPNLSDGCRRAIPHLERCYGQLIQELTDRLSDDDNLDTDFALQEFLDRYGMRLAQLGTIINLVAPLAEAGTLPNESS